MGGIFSSSGKCVAVLTDSGNRFIKDKSQGHPQPPIWLSVALIQTILGTCGQLCGHVDKGQSIDVLSMRILEVISHGFIFDIGQWAHLTQVAGKVSSWSSLVPFYVPKKRRSTFSREPY